MQQPPPIIARFFAAMQAGATAESELLSLFGEQAEYVEPFSGQVRTHRGRDAIRDAMRPGWDTPLPQMRIVVDRVDVDGPRVRAHWTCHSPALPGGRGSGLNVFTLESGQIVRLETTLHLHEAGPT